MNDGSLRPSRFFLKNSVQKAEGKLRQRGLAITSGKVIAEQTLGFWISLFQPHHYRLIGGTPIQAFPHKPTSENRSSIDGKLNRIREFRNRVYHNEPICFNGPSIDFTEAEIIKQLIFDLMEWMDPEICIYIKKFDSIDSKIKSVNYL
ncbi:MAG: hypothetical protein EP332_03985 [Bacteroidetes bacterium]|nr:MAG: hypothetical protein EP332_03985 [Bacteroidota bacterium]